ncbi:hypothetical protein [Parvularcula marina]|uniref:Uncharacterized protein n=1 Tax=Parvularcula marina TaxID=2292771 RepID=A0A371RGK1_9PROT|nr:hypothetical protein [Parvularcula marina]RFB04580.1 hypothetical protein DX908_04365 [Parvularcula marina]
MLFNLLAASAATSTESGDPSTVLLFVLAGVAVLILFAFLASKMFKRQDPENYEEYPLPLDGTNDD